LNTNYLEIAKERIPSVPLLINVISLRVRQLNQGGGAYRPLVKPDSPYMAPMDIALKEVAEGKLTAEMAIASPEDDDIKSEKVISL